MKALVVALALMAADLAAIRDESTVRLVTIGRKSGEPRAATIWFVVDADRVYVQAGKGGATDWFRNLEKTPGVTLEFGERKIPGRATVVADPAESERVHQLFRKKYWLAWAGSWVGIGFGSGRVVRIDVGS